MLFLYCVAVRLFGGYNDKYLSINSTDCYRGIAAVFIVMHHLSQVIGVTGSLKIMGYIGFIMVGVFFFLSGYGLKYGLDHKNNYLSGFLTKKIGCILIPLAFVNIPCFVARILFNQDIDVVQTVLSFVGGPYLTGLWFVTAILLMYLFFM